MENNRFVSSRWGDRLAEVETGFLEVLPDVIEGHLREHAQERVYAAAFWLFYCDRSRLLPPAFAFNSESAVRTEGQGGAAWSTRWVPAEWVWPVVDAVTAAIASRYAALSAVMAGAMESEWEALESAHDAVVTRVARSLNDRFHRDDFVVVALEDRDGPERYEALVRGSVDPERLARLDGIFFV